MLKVTVSYRLNPVPMAYTLTEKEIDKQDDIFDEDKAPDLSKMLKPGAFQKSGLPINAVDAKGEWRVHMDCY